jgi:hypothetical protein
MISELKITSQRYRVLLISFSALFLLMACNSSSANDQSSNDFRASLGEKNVNLNTGIALKKSFPADQTSDEIVSLIVLNHTNEAIYFTNSGFGLQLFCEDEKGNIWQKQNMPDGFVEENRVLPPKTETLNFDLIDINLTNVDKSTVSQVSCAQVRLFVQGTGQDTGKKYGAYTDITITP